MSSGLQDYEVISTIGSGSYGTCKKIRRKKDGKILVWKELDYSTMSASEKAMLVSEVNLLRELKHKHIVRYYDRIIDRGSMTLYILMEYCEGGDLATYINKMKKEGRTIEESFVWKVCYQIILALQVCHSRSKNGKTILHRDLKPANVFLTTNNDVKLGDFGLARVLNHETSFAMTYVGTPYYMSPEQMTYMSYNEKSDVWSVGCLLYELCVFRPPFTASNQRDLATRICIGQFLRLPLRYSADLGEIISYMLQVDENKRPTIDNLSVHPILRKHAPGGSMSISNDSGYSQKLDQLKRRESRALSQETILLEKEKSLKERERLLKEKEKYLGQKEKDLEAKERIVLLRESEVTEQLTRLRLMKENVQKVPSPRTVTDSTKYDLTDREPGEIIEHRISESGTYYSVTGGKTPLCRDSSHRCIDVGDKPNYDEGWCVDKLLADYKERKKTSKGRKSSAGKLLSSPSATSSPLSENDYFMPKIITGKYKRRPLETIVNGNRGVADGRPGDVECGVLSPQGSEGFNAMSPDLPQVVLQDKLLKIFARTPGNIQHALSTIKPLIDKNFPKC